MKTLVLKLLLGTVIFQMGARSAQALLITFDYSLDTNGFFASSSRRAVLESAADVYRNYITDSLSAITPDANNQWDRTFFSPNGNFNITLTNAGAIAADTLLIYVGGYNLSGGALGLGGFGGYSASGFPSWFDTLQGRGNRGALAVTPTDFAPWGGSISFSTSASWYFDTNAATDELFSGNDFYSVSLHEIAHILGIGTAPSWHDQIVGTTFTGSHTGSVAITSDGSHFAEGSMSTVFGTSTLQEAVMDPSLTVGTRKRLSTLDVNALGDVGWQLVPEPNSILLVMLGAFAFILVGWPRHPKSAAGEG
jgi:hypothetical protein